MSYFYPKIPDLAHFEPKSAKSSPNTKMYQGRNVYFSSAYTKRFCGWGLFVYDNLLAIENI